MNTLYATCLTLPFALTPFLPALRWRASTIASSANTYERHVLRTVWETKLIHFIVVGEKLV
jgi:hypothetical protein